MQTIADRISAIIDAECGGKAIVMAERLGIKSASISTWRSGKTNPSSQTIQQIADTFGYNRDWIATGQGEPRSLAPVDQQVIDRLSHAIKYKSSTVDRFIRAVAAAAAAGDEAAIEAAVNFMAAIVDEYRAQAPANETE